MERIPFVSDTLLLALYIAFKDFLSYTHFIKPQPLSSPFASLSHEEH